MEKLVGFLAIKVIALEIDSRYNYCDINHIESSEEVASGIIISFFHIYYYNHVRIFDFSR